eukprot:3711640-Prorocentrum_lima.AAC.1
MQPGESVCGPHVLGDLTWLARAVSSHRATTAAIPTASPGHSRTLPAPAGETYTLPTCSPRSIYL